MRFGLIILLTLLVEGCVTSPVYNPMAGSPPEIALNEDGFKAVQEGMSMAQVHQIMGTGLAIGYEARGTDYKSVTVPNPYRSETIKGTSFVIEYYIEAVRQPDGIVSDDELMPLVFKDGKLIGRGWPLANSLRPRPPA